MALLGLLWHDTGCACGGKERSPLVQDAAQAVRPLVQAQGVRACVQDPERASQVRNLCLLLTLLCTCQVLSFSTLWRQTALHPLQADLQRCVPMGLSMMGVQGLPG
jgi:hypothetical protein